MFFSVNFFIANLVVEILKPFLLKKDSSFFSISFLGKFDRDRIFLNPALYAFSSLSISDNTCNEYLNC